MVPHVLHVAGLGTDRWSVVMLVKLMQLMAPCRINVTKGSWNGAGIWHKVFFY